MMVVIMGCDHCRAQYLRRLDKICSNHLWHSSAILVCD